jgi:diadenosine tetraphosphate (Ap4A) HIT family hydrolase
LKPFDFCAPFHQYFARGTMTATACPFCTLPTSRIQAENEHAVLIRDAFPVSLGHSLVISKRHVESFFDTTDVERRSMLALLDEAKRKVSAEFSADAINIGINDGVAAGQTVPHLHIHVIPRYVSDVADPRGGVRWVLPDKADYWSVPQT